MPTPQIELKQVKKEYYLGGVPQPVLKGIDLVVNPHELISIMGASGSGKTTLLNILGMLDVPTSGDYKITGKNVTHISPDDQANLRNQLIGFVFQQYFLLPDLRIWENVALPLTYRPEGKDKHLLRERAHEMLIKVGLEKYIDHKPNQMSGGQQQRAAIARALVGNPALILADEPTGALDSATGKMIMDLFIGLNQREKLTIVIVTHDPHIGEQCQKLYRLVEGHLSG